MKFKSISVAILLVLIVGCATAQKEVVLSTKTQPVSVENIFKTEGYYNWGGSIVKGEDDQYHMFYSRWPKSTRFSGWLVYSEIAHAVSDHPSGPWTYKETVLQGRGKGHWDAITAHNPKIKHFEGKYYLYYIGTNLGNRADYTEGDLMETSLKGSSHPNWGILRPNMRTGVAVSNSLEGPWVRQDQALIEPSGPITTLAVNPAIDRGKDGRYYLIIKGDKPNQTKFIRNQAIAISDRPDGDFVIQPKPVIGDLDTEDMSLWYDEQREKYYGIFHAHTFLGLVSSVDGLHWGKAHDYEVMKKAIPQSNGGVIKPDRMERPFVYEENGDVIVLGMAVKKGDDSYIVTIPLTK
ncbi:hypothetical protein GCM10028791_20510 [Echinicola sediminis]